jgi:hypothetical protein
VFPEEYDNFYEARMVEVRELADIWNHFIVGHRPPPYPFPYIAIVDSSPADYFSLESQLLREHLKLLAKASGDSDRAKARKALSGYSTGVVPAAIRHDPDYKLSWNQNLWNVLNWLAKNPKKLKVCRNYDPDPENQYHRYLRPERCPKVEGLFVGGGKLAKEDSRPGRALTCEDLCSNNLQKWKHELNEQARKEREMKKANKQSSLNPL